MTIVKFCTFLFLISFFSATSQVAENNQQTFSDLVLESDNLKTAYFSTDLTITKDWDTYMNSNNITDNSIMSLDYVDTESISNKLNMAYPFKRRRHPMEKTGRILTYIGVPLAIIGGIMVAGADELYYECVNGNCSGDARGGFGVVMLGAGAGLAGTGTVLWVIGSKK
jgi:hypothetical protein